MSVPPYSYFSSLPRKPPDDVVDAWWKAVERLAKKDAVIAKLLARAHTQEKPVFVLDLYYVMLSVTRLIGDLQQTWLKLAARVADAPAAVPEEWDGIATDPALHIDDHDRRSHARVYTVVAGAARAVFEKHGLPQQYKVVHSPMFMQTVDVMDASAVDSLAEIASSLALVSWYRDFLLEHPLPNADTIRWIVREIHMNTRMSAQRHALMLAYAFYDVVIGNDLDGGEG